MRDWFDGSPRATVKKRGGYLLLQFPDSLGDLAGRLWTVPTQRNAISFMTRAVPTVPNQSPLPSPISELVMAENDKETVIGLFATPAQADRMLKRIRRVLDGLRRRIAWAVLLFLVWLIFLFPDVSPSINPAAATRHLLPGSGNLEGASVVQGLQSMQQMQPPPVLPPPAYPANMPAWPPAHSTPPRQLQGGDSVSPAASFGLPP